MAPKSVLVLGAGELGMAILQALAAHSSKRTAAISALLRPATLSSQDKAKRKNVESVESLGVEVVAGDVVEDSIEQLSATFREYETIINATGMFAPPGTQTRLCKAAIASGCRRYFPWQFGVDYDVIGPNSSQDLFTEQLEIRSLLRGQENMDWVIVSTGMFTSFLFDPSTGLVNAERDTVMAIGSWENSITVTSPRDIGRLTAEIALAAPDIKGVVFTAGDTVSMQRLADIVDKVWDRKVKRTLKTVPQLKEELAADPDNAILKYQVVFGEGTGVSWDTAKTFNVQRGISIENAEQWATQHLSA